MGGQEVDSVFPARMKREPELDFARGHGGGKIFKKVEDLALTKRAIPLCCCPAEMRTPGIPQSVLLFGLMGEPVSISQLIGSDWIVYSNRRNAIFDNVILDSYHDGISGSKR